MKQIAIYTQEKKTISLYFVLSLYNKILSLFMFKILIFAYHFFPNYYRQDAYKKNHRSAK